MPKILAGLLLMAGTLGLPRLGHAQTGTGGTGGTAGVGGANLAAADFFIGVQGEKGINLSDYDVGIYFNKANCQCDRPTWIFAALSEIGLAKRSLIIKGTAQLWIGSGCEQALLRPTQCVSVGSSLFLTDLAAQGGIAIETTARVLSTPRATTAGGAGGAAGTSGAGGSGGATVVGDPCVSDFAQNIFLLVDQDADGTPEVAPVRQVEIDASPPTPPTNVVVRGGNEALVVDWTAVDTSVEASNDLRGYQLLCKRAGEFQVFKTGSFAAGYSSTATTCPSSGGSSGTLESLDPAFLCSGLLSPVATSQRIKVLQNDIFYGVSVIAIDRHGNASASALVEEKPVASRNFYATYRNGDIAFGQPLPDSPDPGGDKGGYCTVAGPSRRGWAAVPAFGLLGAAIALALRRRRRLPR